MKTKLYGILTILTLLRLAVAAFGELSPEEAHYYQWSQRPDLAYYSAGPGVALTILSSTKILGASELGVRFFAPLLGLGTSLLVFALGCRIYDERTGFWAAIFAQCLPAFNLGTIFMTTTALSCFFWLLSVWSLWRALEKSPRWTLWWPATGLAIGLGTLCDYLNLSALISMMLALAVVRAWRPEWKRPGVYSATAVALACLTPILLWNRNHGWITLTELNQGKPWDAASFVHLELPFVFMGSLFKACSPLLFLALLVSFCCGLWNIRNHRKTAFLLSFSAPAAFFHLTISLFDAVDPLSLLFALLPLVLFSTHDWLRRLERRPGLRLGAPAALVLGLVISCFIDLPAGWKKTGETVAEVRKELEQKIGSPVFLVANNYQTASALTWFLPKASVAPPESNSVYLPESQMIQSQYSFWPSYDTFSDAEAHELDPFNTEELGVNRFVGRNALYVTDRAEGKPSESLIRGFERWEFYGERSVPVQGSTIRLLRFFVCYNYRTLPL